jgi:AbrB family looped-hinge helix DNA binding protein
MNRPTRAPSAFSKVSVKGQTVIPRPVRERLRLQPGDTLRYRLTEDGVLLDNQRRYASSCSLPYSFLRVSAKGGLVMTKSMLPDGNVFITAKLSAQ